MKIGRVSLPVLITVAVGLVLFVTIPMVTNKFQTYEFASVAVYLVAVIGLNVLTGYSGQISLGNAAFMAVGGYATALLVKYAGVPWWLTLPVAGLLSGVFGFLFGIPALRLRGIYLALATFALSLVIYPLINWRPIEPYTHGRVGINLPAIEAPAWSNLSNEQWLYFLVWIIAAIVFIPAWKVLDSKVGRAWMAIRDSEAAAAASGINLAYYKAMAFGVSACYAGIAGAMQVLLVAYVNSDSYGLNLSLALLIGVVIGGLGNVWGPLFGALLVVWLPYFSERLADVKVAGLNLGRPDIGFGILLILIVYFAPSGIAGLIQRAIHAYRRRRTAARGGPGEDVADIPVLAEAATGDR